MMYGMSWLRLVLEISTLYFAPILAHTNCSLTLLEVKGQVTLHWQVQQQVHLNKIYFSSHPLYC